MRLPVAAIVLAAAAALALGALALRSAGTTTIGSCGSLHGGGSGGRSQLRFVDAREDHATFTFGQSQEGQFQAPTYELAEGARENGHRVFTLVFGTTSTVNPDGSPSLESLALLQPADRALREVRLVGEKDLTVTWRLESDGGCPRVRLKRYTQGTFPRVQIAVLFDVKGAVTVEPATAVGPQVWVSGIDFAPEQQIDVELNDVVVTARSESDGSFEKALYVYDLPPGLYRVAARDRTGRVAHGSLLVPLVPIVPDLTPRR